MPSVEVRDADGKLIHTYQILVDGYDTLITTKNLCDMAKRNAIEDELVSENQADELTFSVVD